MTILQNTTEQHHYWEKYSEDIQWVRGSNTEWRDPFHVSRLRADLGLNNRIRARDSLLILEPANSKIVSAIPRGFRPIIGDGFELISAIRYETLSDTPDPLFKVEYNSV